MWNPHKPLPPINPDGLTIKIPYSKWEVGMSVFVPSINLPKLRTQIKRVARQKGWRVEFRERIEDGKLGLRIWRIV